MTPVYFPLTYVTDITAQALAACFLKTIVYQPLPENLPAAMQKNIFDIRVPIQTDGPKIQALLKEYQQWAAVHQRSGLSSFKSQAGKTPFFDEFSAYQLRQDIKDQDQPDKNRDKKKSVDPIFQARTFLCIAQNFDAQNWELAKNLENFSQLETELFKDLRGDDVLDELTARPPSAKDDLAKHMTAKRLEAWANLAGHDSEITNFFVTDSLAAFELVQENLSLTQMETVLTIENIPIDGEPDRDWQKRLADYLQNLEGEIITGPDRSGQNNNNITLTIYRAAVSSAQFIKSLACRKPVADLNADNILIGLIS